MADPTGEYCSYEDVLARLTSGGYLYVADRDDLSGSGVQESERDRYILTAIQYAGGLIDVAVDTQYAISAARGSGSQWLRDRAVDIAAYRAATHGGEEVSEAFTKAYDDARDLLNEVKMQLIRVPGLRNEQPRTGRGRAETIGMPSVSNPKRRRRGGGGRRRRCQ